MTDSDRPSDTEGPRLVENEATQQIVDGKPDEMETAVDRRKILGEHRLYMGSEKPAFGVLINSKYYFPEDNALGAELHKKIMQVINKEYAANNKKIRELLKADDLPGLEHTTAAAE